MWNVSLKGHSKKNVQMYSRRIRWILEKLLMFLFYSSIMDHSLQYSIYYWLWLFLSLNAVLLILVCSQCSTTRHSACLWRYIPHLVFDILPVGSLMFSWQTVCHQVLAAGHLKTRSLGSFYEREWNTRCVWISMCVRECRWNHEVVFERICMHMCRGQILSHTLNALRICARSLREAFLYSGVFGSVFFDMLESDSLSKLPEDLLMKRCVYVWDVWVCMLSCVTGNTLGELILLVNTNNNHYI